MVELSDAVDAVANSLREGGEFGVTDVQRIDDSEDVGFMVNGEEFFVTIERA